MATVDQRAHSWAATVAEHGVLQTCKSFGVTSLRNPPSSGTGAAQRGSDIKIRVAEYELSYDDY